MKDRLHIRSDFALNQTTLVQLDQQTHDLVLGQRIIRIVGMQGLTHSINRAAAIAASNKRVGRCIHSVKTSADRIGQHVPHLVPIDLPGNPHLRTKTWMQACHPVPLVAEDAGGHFSAPTNPTIPDESSL